MTKSVLVTGAGGFLGRHLAAQFREDGWRPAGVGRSDPDGVAGLYDVFQANDLSDTNRIATLFDKLTPDLVIHLAAPSSVAESMRQPLADFEQHLLPLARLLEAMRLAATRARLLLLSSAAVYGQPRALPVAESAPAEPLSPYGFHKLQQELLCDEYYRLFGIPVVKARVFSTFGEGLRRLAVWDLTRRALAGDATVLGTGSEVRDYLYAGDVASALSAIAARADFAGEAINVASGSGIAISELAARIFALAGSGAPPRFSGAAPEGSPTAWTADVARLRGFGWSPRWQLDDALRRTVEWIRGHA